MMRSQIRLFLLRPKGKNNASNILLSQQGAVWGKNGIVGEWVIGSGTKSNHIEITNEQITRSSLAKNVTYFWRYFAHKK